MKPKSVGSADVTKSRMGPRRFLLPFRVDPSDQREGTISWWDRLRKDALAGSAGLFVSLLVHFLAVIFLGMIVFQTRQIGNGDPLIATWIVPGERPERSTKMRRPVDIPIEVASIANSVFDETKPLVTSKGEGSTTIGVRPVDVSRALEDRKGAGEASNLGKSGGSPDAEQAIKAALAWLVRQQTSDGHWELHQGYPDAGRSSIKTDTGATALALLAFLGHDQTHQTGEYQAVVAKGLKWLRKVQDPATGDLHDQRQEEGRNPAFYAHSMGTIALCEALALTRDDELKPSAELAVKYLVNSQHPDLGGWKYRPLSMRVMSGDLSVTAWALMALHSARIAGIEVPLEEFDRSSRFLDQVQEQGGSRYKYEPNEPASRVTAARTAIGLLCRQWLGWPKTHPPMVDGVRFLMEDRYRPQWTAGRRNVFEWYYISQVMHNVGGDEWRSWNRAVRETLVRNQLASGGTKAGSDIRGSWSPKPEGAGEEYAEKAGRLYLTAMCVLILETPYRHRPVYAD